MVIGLAAAAAIGGATASYDAYGSWLLACDNGLTCVAKGFQDGGGDVLSEVDLTRTAGPRGALRLVIASDHPFTLSDVKIDGKPAGLGPPAWRLEPADQVHGPSIATDRLDAARALVARLRNATTLSLGPGGEVPLEGISAALLRMDERQGRLNGVTALIRTGAAPSAQVPPAPPLPKIPERKVTAALAAGEDKRLIARVRAAMAPVFKQEDCETGLDQAPAAFPLGERQGLVFIPCLQGAYQGSSLVYIVPRSGGAPVHFAPTLPVLGKDLENDPMTVMTEVDFDPDAGALTTTAKGRGIADCGMSAAYRWDGERFQLAELSLQQACGGIEPGDWPTVFSSTK
jgi:hypothetical protein